MQQGVNWNQVFNAGLMGIGIGCVIAVIVIVFGYGTKAIIRRLKKRKDEQH